ncbi:ribosomal protein S18-alanine N-acetyltransferase [Caldisericum exile]|uniref:[Ribosomal protein bS18]-alanine N-acetyltransferase n=1 Tax=Caldisericum exile (strain DSM 21853 / NBRC 104410 / AZM16c01) TaxID=511051 RepID=A0A7U6GF99_CALEA|nr:ribosomal protein S18-alanine N-acetyltransferase [Caldisericum exile]BAL81347.1 putative ribosomal-protein-alanine acetyltransferase [Caldisericum exile AZM16c01]
MISEIEIVKAKINDVKKIIEIEELSYNDPWPREIFMVDYLFNASSDYFVAKLHGKVIGFIGVWYEGKKLHIINVAVHPNERGKGIGTSLLLFAISLAKELGYEVVYLEARKSNISAQKLYKKLGFIEVEELKGYYQDGEDGIRMELKITKEEGN